MRKMTVDELRSQLVKEPIECLSMGRIRLHIGEAVESSEQTDEETKHLLTCVTCWEKVEGISEIMIRR